MNLRATWNLAPFARGTFVALLALLATGCATRAVERGVGDARGVAEERLAVPPGSVAAGAGDASESVPSPESAPSPEAPLGPDEAVRLALARDRRVAAILAELSAELAEARGSWMPENPTISLEALWPEAVSGLTALEIEAAQNLVSLASIPHRRETARAAAERAGLHAAHEIVSLGMEARRAWIEARFAEDLLAPALDEARCADAAHDLAKSMLEAGNLPEIDVLETRLAAERARMHLDEARAESMLACERLIVALGLHGEAADRLALAPAADAEPDAAGADDVESIAVARRLDLAEARAGVELAGARLRSHRAWRWFGSGVEAGGKAERDGDGSRAFGAVFGFALPIFDRGQHELLALRSDLARAESELVARAVEARSEARRARDRLALARMRHERARDHLLPAAQARLVEATRRYDYMIDGAFDLLEARREVAEVERTRLETARDAWIARVDLMEATGGVEPMDGMDPMDRMDEEKEAP